MGSQQEFWEKLKLKYEEKNRVLQQREHELRIKLEAMDAIVGDCSHGKSKEVAEAASNPSKVGSTKSKEVAEAASNPSKVGSTNETQARNPVPTTRVTCKGQITNKTSVSSPTPTAAAATTSSVLPSVVPRTVETPFVPRIEEAPPVAPRIEETPPVAPTMEENQSVAPRIDEQIISEQPPESVSKPEPPQQAKGGIFDCFFNLFGSSKAKPAPAQAPQPTAGAAQAIPEQLADVSQRAPEEEGLPAPQDAPTRDDAQFVASPELCQKKKQSLPSPELCQNKKLSIPSPELCQVTKKNENCMCNPCEADIEQPSTTVENAQQQVVETSEVCQREGNRVYKNENCACSPCEVEIDDVQVATAQPQSDEPTAEEPELCHREGNSVFKNEDCVCSPCEVDAVLQNKPNLSKGDGNGNACNCSICSRYSILGESEKRCPCVWAEDVCAPQPKAMGATPGGFDAVVNLQSKTTEPRNSFNRMVGDTNAPASALENFGRGSKLSLKSTDIYYMKNIHDLATQQKDLLKEVNTLEQKARIYENIFEEYKNVDFSGKNRTANSRGFADLSDDKGKTNAELKLENFLLKNELKDMRLDVRQYLERMEGPMQYKIESERYKCLQLEKQLEEAARQITDMQNCYEKEMNSLKMQLCSTSTNLYNLTAMNDQITHELQEYQKKCAKLEEDLIRQKISEAETIKSLQAALSAQASANVVKDDCDLHQIARELSKVLRDCEPCGDCVNLPEDLTSTARLLKSLTDMVDCKLNQAQGEPQDLFRPQAKPQDLFKTAAVSKDIATKDGGVGILEIHAVQEVTGVRASRTSAVKQASFSIAVEAPPPMEEKTSRTSKTSSGKRESLSAVKDAPQIEEKSSRTSKGSKRESVNIETIQERSSKTSKTSSVKRESLTVTNETPQAETKRSSKASVKRESLPQVETRTSKASKTGSLDVGAPTTELVTEEEIQPTQNVDEKEEPPKLTDEPPVSEVKSERKSSVVADDKPTIPTTAFKPTCACVKPKKSKEVDQIWPKTDLPVTLKDSDVLDVPPAPSTKKKCECGVSKKPKEKEPQNEDQTSGKKICKCGPSVPDEMKAVEPIEARKLGAAEVDQLWPKSSERFRLSHQVTTSRSKDLLKSETSIKCLKVKENFPFDIDTQVDVLNKPPDGVHVTTTITDSGTLEVITEGPEGVIETTLIYTKSGNVEVVTEILDYRGKGKGKGCKGGKSKNLAIEGAETSNVVKSSTSEPLKPLEETTNVKVDARKSGPVGVSPDCLCQDCPVLEFRQSTTPTPEKTPDDKPLPSSPAEDQPTTPQGDQTIEVQPEQTTEPQVPDAEVPTEVVQDANLTQATPEVASESPNVAVNPEDITVSTTVQETSDAVEATVSKQVSDVDKEIVKTLSLSMHAENPDDVLNLAQVEDNSKESPSQ